MATLDYKITIFKDQSHATIHHPHLLKMATTNSFCMCLFCTEIRAQVPTLAPEYTRTTGPYYNGTVFGYTHDALLERFNGAYQTFIKNMGAHLDYEVKKLEVALEKRELLGRYEQPWVDHEKKELEAKLMRAEVGIKDAEAALKRRELEDRPYKPDLDNDKKELQVKLMRAEIDLRSAEEEFRWRGVRREHIG